MFNELATTSAFRCNNRIGFVLIFVFLKNIIGKQ